MIGISGRFGMPIGTASSALLMLAALGVACGGDDLRCNGPFCVSPPEVPQPSNLLPIPDNPQQGAPRRALSDSIGVQVTDSDDRPVSGVIVDFSVSSGGGTLTSTSAASDNQGFARVGWELGAEVGTQELQATALDTSGAHLHGSPLLLSVSAQQPLPDTLILRPTISETAQNGVPLEQQPVLEVLDAEDQPVPNVEVVASVASGGGSLLGSTTVSSNDEGLAAFTDLILVGAQGGHVLRFSVANPPLETTSAPIQLSAGAPETLAANGPLTFEATVNSPVSPGPSVVVRDAAGNGIPGVTVFFTPNRNASVSPEAATTNEQGIAQVSWTLGSTANVEYTLAARTESAAIPPVRFSATARAGAAGRLRVAVQPSSPTESGTAFARQPVIQVVDRQGNPTPQAGITVTAAISSGPTGSLANQTATTNGAGEAAFSGLTLTGEVGNYTLSFSASGLAGVTSAPFNITTGSAARLALVRPPSTLARSRHELVIQPIVEIQDASGNPIRQAGIQVVITATPSGTVLAGETATTNENGRATFSGLTITGIPGPRDLTFSAPGLGSVSARVTLFSVETVSITPSHPVSAVVGTTIAGPVTTWILRDASTRPVADADFTLTASSGGTALPLAPFSDVNGAVQAGDWTLGPTAGYQYLTFRLPDGREFRDSILATHDVEADLLIASGDNQSAPANSTLPDLLVVRVVDRYGNGVPNILVQWLTCEGQLGDAIPTDANGYSGTAQPTGTQPSGDGTFCTRASVSTPMLTKSVDFHYTVTAAASQEEPSGISGASSRHSGPPPVAPQKIRSRGTR